MFVRGNADRLQAELPPPSDPDPDGAAAVRELLGGRFGQMSTLLNYTLTVCLGARSRVESGEAVRLVLER
jgi:Mn-containing catalase